MYYSPCDFREDTAPKQLTYHNARNHGPAETECFSGELCGRQDLPRRHQMHAHYLSLCVHLKCVASDICVNI